MNKTNTSISSKQPTKVVTSSTGESRKIRRLKQRLQQLSENFSSEVLDRFSRLQSLTSGIDEQFAEVQHSETLAQEIAILRSQLSENNEKIADAKAESTHLRGLLRSIEAEYDELTRQLALAPDDSYAHLSSAEKRRLSDLETENALLREEVAESETKKHELKARLEEFESNLSGLEDSSGQSSPNRNSTTNELEVYLRGEIENLEGQILFLSNELDVTRESQVPADIATSKQVNDLRTQLLDSRRETVELRMQNTDLADQIAKLQMNSASGVSAPLMNETTSWEERKRRLLAQLQAEDDHSENEESKKERLAMKDLIATTQIEITKRDQEIDELRQIVEQQASAHDGIAVGAAALASMMNEDVLMEQEREKLRQIQKEWEDKLRQSEIEFSRERARLARERLELEAVQRRLETVDIDNSKETAASNEAKRGKWLARLGLRDS